MSEGKFVGHALWIIFSGIIRSQPGKFAQAQEQSFFSTSWSAQYDTHILEVGITHGFPIGGKL